MILVLATKPFFVLRGPDAGLELMLTTKTLLLPALSIVTYLGRSKSHPKWYGWVLEPGFNTLRKDG